LPGFFIVYLGQCLESEADILKDHPVHFDVVY